MGRTKKAILNKDETSNACPVMTTAKDTLHLPTENSNAIMNDEIKLQPNSDSPAPNKKNSIVMNVVLRRSSRRTNSVLQTQNQQNSKPVVNHVINLLENEKEEAPHCQQLSALPILSEKDLEKDMPQAPQDTSVPVGNDRNLNEKIDYIVRAVEEFKSKLPEQFSGRTNEGPSSDFNYKSLYIDSQKKVEALMEEKFELVKELEYARGQIAAYEKMKDAMCGRKEVIYVSGLGRATEDIIVPERALSTAEDDRETSPKRKKTKYSKKRARP